MNCKDCGRPIGYLDHRLSMDSLGVELCSRHRTLIQRIKDLNGTPDEAIRLYYGLKEAGAQPMLEWWDGKKSVHIAFSRVKLNIEIDPESHSIDHRQAIADLNEAMHSFKEGFTTLRIPGSTVRLHLKETVDQVLGIVEELRASIKVIS